jgi:hypothetical protein
VRGTLTIEGETIEVHGAGYHDHQWGNFNFWLAWNNWLWSRQSFEDYSILVFDMVAGKDFGFERFPICFIQDKHGTLVFQNTHGVTYEALEEYRDETSGKDYPKVSKYSFDHDGTYVDYRLSVDEVIEATDAYHSLPEQARAAFDRLGLQPSYSRYSASGALTISRNGETTERSGKLIYEFMYPGASPYREHV